MSNQHKQAIRFLLDNDFTEAADALAWYIEHEDEISRDRSLAIAHGYYGPVLPTTPSTITYTEGTEGMEPFTVVTCAEGWAGVASQEDSNE